MDFVVQKGVELGVSTITPLFSERCNVKLNAERAQSRVQHWQHIAMSACEQSGRIHVPTVNPIVDVSHWMNDRDEQRRFICHPESPKNKDDTKNVKSIALLIGPEGGFTDDEVAFAIKKDFQPMCLGPRILRTETATVVGLTLLQFQFGDFVSHISS